MKHAEARETNPRLVGSEFPCVQLREAGRFCLSRLAHEYSQKPPLVLVLVSIPGFHFGVTLFLTYTSFRLRTRSFFFQCQQSLPSFGAHCGPGLSGCAGSPKGRQFASPFCSPGNKYILFSGFTSSGVARKQPVFCPNQGLLVLSGACGNDPGKNPLKETTSWMVYIPGHSISHSLPIARTDRKRISKLVGFGLRSPRRSSCWSQGRGALLGQYHHLQQAH